ncbi:hypothetical protein [Tissierella praeacuta]|uniref:hypothetical protein n=1 Tax=Tissierella praeacuta TaxID=43131 RepID=UPI0028ABF271|nr:hypothetical protein [Tissierella praeacuta]
MEWKENLTQEEYEKAIQSAEDKVRTEYTKKIKALEEKLPVEKSERELELEQKEKELLAKENEYKVKDALAEKELPSQLAKYLKIEDFDTDVDEIVGVLNTYLLNNSHKPINKKNNDGITKEQFKKMSYAERIKLENSNPELYKKLI